MNSLVKAAFTANGAAFAAGVIAGLTGVAVTAALPVLTAVVVGWTAGRILYDPVIAPLVESFFTHQFESDNPEADFVNTYIPAHQPPQRVLDGYLAGATVFVDVNKNGVLNNAEASTTTNASGQFHLNPGSGPLIAFGGTDVSTGLPFKGQISAPPNSAVISPLTTLLNDLQSDSAAEQKILKSLGLSSTFDFANTDPIAAAKAGDAAGAAAYVAGAKAYDTVSLIASALTGLGAGYAGTLRDAFTALASAIAGPGIDLDKQTDVSALIAEIAKSEGHSLANGSGDELASAIVASNAALDQALTADKSGQPLLISTAAIELLAQGAESGSFAGALGNPDRLTTVTDLFTGNSLENLISQAQDQVQNLGKDVGPVAIGATVNETEGLSADITVATFLDLDPNVVATDFTATISWGDGTTTAGTIVDQSGTFDVDGTHIYKEEGKYTVGVTIKDVGGSTATTTSNAKVVDAPLTASGASIKGVEGSSTGTAAIATFTDADPYASASDFTATIDWGDGTTTAGSVVAHNGTFEVDGAHTYKDEGKYSVGVSIKDVGGSTASAKSTATIADADVLAGKGLSLQAHVGQNLKDVVVATFNDTYTGNVASDFTATINWGDGVTSAGVVSDVAGKISVAGSHTYEKSGHDTVTVTLRDDPPGTASATATSKVTVPSAKLRIKPVDGDNVINYAEAHSSHGVLITGSEKGLVVGETFNVTVTDHGLSKTYTAGVGDKGSWSATMPMADAVKLANGTANVTAQIGNVKASEKVTVAEILPTVTINKVNGNDVIIDEVASCGDRGNHGEGGRDRLSVGWQQWTDDNDHHGHAHEHDSDSVTLSGTVSGIAPHSKFQVTLHDASFSKSFKATVNATGNTWVANIPGREVAELPTGTATIAAQVTDRYGNTSLPAVQHVTVKAGSDKFDLGQNDCDASFETKAGVSDHSNEAAFTSNRLFNQAGNSFSAGSTLAYPMGDNSTNALLSGGGDNHLANIALLQQYMSSSFVAPGESHGVTLVSEQPRTEHPLLSLPHA